MPSITKNLSGTFGIKVQKITANGKVKAGLGVLHGMVVNAGDVALHDSSDATGTMVLQLQAGDGNSAYTLPKPYSFGADGMYAVVTGTTVAFIYYE